MIRQPITAHIGCTSTTLHGRSTTGASGGPRRGGGHVRGCGRVTRHSTNPSPGPQPRSDPAANGCTRILLFEAKIADVVDRGGSYFMESLTDETRPPHRRTRHIEGMAAPSRPSRTATCRKRSPSAYERQKRIDNQEDFIVGVNCVRATRNWTCRQRVVDELYDPVTWPLPRNAVYEARRAPPCAQERACGRASPTRGSCPRRSAN